jgi:hypothetical protein
LAIREAPQRDFKRRDLKEKSDIPALLSADILALRLQRMFADPLLWNFCRSSASLIRATISAASYAVPSDRVVDADYYARAVRNRRLSDPASGRPRRAAGSPNPVIQVVGRITASDTQLKSLVSFYGIIRHFARRRHRVYFWNSTFQWLSPMKQEA